MQEQEGLQVSIQTRDTASCSVVLICRQLHCRGTIPLPAPFFPCIFLLISPTRLGVDGSLAFIPVSYASGRERLWPLL